MALYATRADLKRDFYLLTGSSSSDTALTEHDNDSGANLNAAILHGVWLMQQYLVEQGYMDRWTATSAALSFSGSDDTGGRYATLPADFLALAGDERDSALHEANGNRWGRLVPEERQLHRWQGDYYAVRDVSGGGDDHRLWLAKLAAPPTALYADYVAKHAAFANDAATLDAPEEVAPLAAAFAAHFAMFQTWLPGGDEMRRNIAANLEEKKNAARRWARRHKSPLRYDAPPAEFGGRFW